MADSHPEHSLIDPYYSSGAFFAASSGAQDAAFKVSEFSRLFQEYAQHFDANLTRIADVGCGTGDTTRLLANRVAALGYQAQVHGYDIHPYIEQQAAGGNVTFYQRDFCASDMTAPYDLAVLFDVIEHVPDPIAFLKAVAKRTKLVALHIPLDDTPFGWLRGLPHSNLAQPGHLVVLNAASSLNLLAFAGLRVQEFAFTPAFRAPSGKVTQAQRLLNPLREIFYRLSPYLLQRTLGGVSLMVIAQTESGLRAKKRHV